MVLATIIRLEMAYPGVGILAGDSLQYLSVVTAHAVIMVFFMIMPLLFGAFGNFLLPTQLGVHDVAFPRLNSAAFWFLPAGLIMLCQLVCLDRRYQRMNCFNIREIQAILKGRFFHDLINTDDHRDFLDKTTIGIRFKTNSIDSINPNMLLMFRYGVNSTPQSKFQTYKNVILEDHSQREFFNPTSPMLLALNSLQNVFSHVFFSSFYQISFYVLSTIQKGVAITQVNIYGKATFFGFFQLNGNFFKNEFDRYVNNILHLFNLNEPLWVFTNYYRNWYFLSLENMMWGLMDNNMGHHKMRKFLRPKNEHPEIITSPDVTLQYMVFTILHSLASRSIFVLLRGIKANNRILQERLAKKFNDFLTQVEVFFTDIYTGILFDGGILLNNIFVSTWLVFMGILLEFSTNFLMGLHQFYTTAKEFTTNPSEVSALLMNRVLNHTSFDAVFGLIGTSKTIHNAFSFLSNSTNQVQDSTIVESINYSSQAQNPYLVADSLLFTNEESSSNFRYQKFQNPVFKADYKSGNYFTKVDLERFPHMINTFIELTGGIRKPSWIFSDVFIEQFNDNFNNYINNFSTKATGTSSAFNVNISSTFGFFNFFHVLSSESTFINHRWLSVNALDQKFYRIFNTSSMQQRIYSNWRQLKFTREAWRCKLLAARHQKTMYKRYLNEDGLLWTLERNAKDVLPGWAMITPFSARTRFTAIGKVDIGLMGVFLVLNSSIVSSANFLVTYRYLSTLNNRKMRDARSFFTEGVMVASWMMIAANPMLVIGILMLLSDRHWQTSFFDYSGGGDTVLFQHMFWFFGHPEVYVIMIPAFGFNNTILSFYLRKRVSARASLLYSIYTIAFLGFFVWGHHMYMVGLAHTTRMLFSTLTVMISVPAATKLMHWCVTLVNSSFSVELPFIFTLLFIFFFVSGGISGMAVAHTGMDILFHDSFYVVGHFHVLFAGSAMFASFGAFYFYFASIFGVKFSRIWGYLHCIYYLLGQLMTVIPMFWLGYSGMPRRVLDYPAALGGWHAITSAGHLLSVAGMLAFFIMIFDSLRQGRPAVRNTLGVSRFNTRLNFYLYEIARIRFVQRKGWSISRYNRVDSLQLNELNFTNNELLEVTLYSYTFVEESINFDRQ
jgi:heme/copper-type cytochrome/quinol oxidase subunit 1